MIKNRTNIALRIYLKTSNEVEVQAEKDELYARTVNVLYQIAEWYALNLKLEMEWEFIYYY